MNSGGIDSLEMTEPARNSKTDHKRHRVNKLMSGPLPQQPPPDSAKPPPSRVKRATSASVSGQPRATTAEALKGYAYLKSLNSRNRSQHSPPQGSRHG
jgi:hypothetical protein